MTIKQVLTGAFLLLVILVSCEQELKTDKVYIINGVVITDSNCVDTVGTTQADSIIYVERDSVSYKFYLTRIK